MNLEIVHEIPVSVERHEKILKAIKLTDRIVYGGTLNTFVERIIVHANSWGNSESKLLQGIADIYDGSKTIHLHLKHDGGHKHFTEWGVVHDLCHLWDIVHGNLTFDIENDTLTYLGKTYKFVQGAIATIPEHRTYGEDSFKPHGGYKNYRNNVFYTAMCYYEPWETKALFLADNVWNELNKEHFGPNYLGEIA